MSDLDNFAHHQMRERAKQIDWSAYFAIAPPPTRNPRAGFFTRILRVIWRWL